MQRASFAENLEIVELSLEYRHGDGWLRALDRVSFTVAPQEVFGLAGESGCGKSSLAYSCLGYLPANARATSGQVLFRGDDVLRLDRERLRRLRGARISLVPQNPTTALNPGMRAGEQTVESLLYHGAVASRRLARERTKELFDGMGLPEAMMRRYPHELSGGQQQRVCIAIALACGPGAGGAGRADHRARRDHAGADPDAAQPAARAHGHVYAVCHPRPRRAPRRSPTAWGSCTPATWSRLPRPRSCSATPGIPTAAA